MNKPKRIHLIVFLGLTFLFSNSTLAVTFTCTSQGVEYEAILPSFSEGGFDVINSQCETLIKENWNSFNMKKRDWVGWGFHNMCNKYTPINRTFRALELLRISKNPGLKKDVLLNKAYDFSKTWINRLTPLCSKRDILGTHISKELLENEKFKEAAGEEAIKEILSVVNSNDPDRGTGFVFLTQRLFDNPIVLIATVILHEARHKKKAHNGKNGCPRGSSCDTSFGYYGANAVALHYSWWYGLASKNSNQFTRQIGLDFARFSQNNFFNIPPTFNIPKIAK
jgi:hypothetical protein